MRAGRQVPPFQRNVTFPKESSLHNLGRKIFKVVIHYVSPVAQCEPKLRFNNKLYKVYENSPIPVAARSKKWVCGLSLVGNAGSKPAGGKTSVSYECCVLSGTGLCFGLITRPENFCWVWCVSE
jgi:hypothetical protein